MDETKQLNPYCRITTQEDLVQVMKLWETCFDDTMKFVLWYFTCYWKPEHTLGIFETKKDAEVLLASAQVIPYELHVRDAALSCGYIVGVDTAPEARNRGYARWLMQECLQLQRKRGECISLLMPFEGQFYYRYGWPFCYFHQRIITDAKELRCAAKAWGTVRRVNLYEAQEAMQKIYEIFTKRYHGTVNRTVEQWRLQLEDAQMENTVCFLIEDDANQAQGYFMWTPLKGKCYVREIAWCHERAKAGMLHYLMQNVSESDKIWLELPEDDSMKYQMAASKTDIVLYPFLMARIVDVKQCLEQLSYSATSTEVVLRVQDEFALWNTGSFYISVHDGTACVSLLSVAEEMEILSKDVPEGALTIDALSQLVMGTKDAEDLWQQELLSCEIGMKERLVSALQELWPKQQTYINEYY